MTDPLATRPDPKLVDAQFWTDWFADHVSGAVARRDEAAARLMAAVGWFWTVYTAVALLGASVADRATLSGWQILVVFLPVATLSVSYLCALWALSPIVGSAIQTERAARDLWAQLLKDKGRRLLLSGATLVMSAVLIVVAGVLVATSR